MRHRRSRWNLPTWALLGTSFLAPLAGCGGGGSGSSGSSSQPTAPTARLLAPQAGQSWSYQLSGTVTSSGIAASASGAVTDTYTATSSGSTSSGLELVTSGKLQAGLLSVPLDTVEALQIDNSGNVYVAAVQTGSTSSLDYLAAPILIVPGTFTSSFSYTGSSATTAANSPFSVMFSVVGQATVTVPAGTFNTWKVAATIVEGTVTSTETEYFAPEIGSFVKSTVTATDASTPKSSLSVTAELTSTNVSL